MSQLLDLVKRQLDGGTVATMASQIGASPGQTRTAVEAALPALLAGLQGNATSPGGASSLAAALDRDHDGSILDDVAGFLGQGPSAAGQRSVGHIFGDRQGHVTQAVAQHSGLDSGQVMSLLAMLAPLVLGALGRARQQGGAGAATGGGGLGDLLGAALGGLQGGGASGGLGGILGGLLGGGGSAPSGDEGGGGGQGGGLGDILGGLLGGRR